MSNERPSGLVKRTIRFFATLWDWKTPVIVGAILILVGIGLLLRYDETHWLPQKLAGLFASELGFACVIAALIFATLEEWAARHHAKTAIGLLYGVKPEGDVFDKIEQHVLKQKFYRSKLVVTYAFKKQDDRENILVEQTTKYVLKNVCSKYDRSTLDLCGNTDLKPLHTGITEWDGDLGLKKLTLIRKRGGELIPEIVSDERVERTPDFNARTERYRLKEGISLAFEETLGVEAVHHFVVHDHDSTVWTSGYPSTELEFHVTWDEPIRLKVALCATHPELEQLAPEIAPRGHVVRLEQPFLKGHGMHVRWSPDESAPAPPPSAEPA